MNWLCIGLIYLVLIELRINMKEKPDAPATQRNKRPILNILKKEIQDSSVILEIGSGTGQHAIFFAEKMPWVTWQTSDVLSNHEGIQEWLETYKGINIKPPLALEIGYDQLNVPTIFDHVFSSNTSHIMSYNNVKKMFALIAKILPKDGKFFLYGPFNIEYEYTSDSNRNFDVMLKEKSTSMGIRNIEDLDLLAKLGGLSKHKLCKMPANNFLSIWKK